MRSASKLAGGRGAHASVSDFLFFNMHLSLIWSDFWIKNKNNKNRITIIIIKNKCKNKD